jgi:hypothetical protein
MKEYSEVLDKYALATQELIDRIAKAAGRSREEHLRIVEKVDNWVLKGRDLESLLLKNRKTFSKELRR